MLVFPFFASLTWRTSIVKLHDLLDVALPYIAPVGIEIMVLLMSPAGGRQLWVPVDDWRKRSSAIQSHHTHIYDIPALHSRR